MFPANMFSYKGMIIEHTKYRTMILFHSFMIKCRPLGGKKETGTNQRFVPKNG